MTGQAQSSQAIVHVSPESTSPEMEPPPRLTVDRRRGQVAGGYGPIPHQRPMTMPEATFVAGAAVAHAHHASQVASEAASAAMAFQSEAEAARTAAANVYAAAQSREADFERAANVLRAEAAQQVQAAQSQALQWAESQRPILQREAEAGAAQWAQAQALEATHAAERQALQWADARQREMEHQAKAWMVQQNAQVELSQNELHTRLARQEEEIRRLQSENSLLAAASRPLLADSPLTPNAAPQALAPLAPQPLGRASASDGVGQISGCITPVSVKSQQGQLADQLQQVAQQLNDAFLAAKVSGARPAGESGAAPKLPATWAQPQVGTQAPQASQPH